MKKFVFLFICLFLSFQAFATPFYDPNASIRVYDSSCNDKLLKQLKSNFIKKYTDPNNPNRLIAPEDAYEREVVTPYWANYKNPEDCSYYLKYPKQTKYNVTHKDINDYLYYIKIHPYKLDEKGKICISYTEYSDQGISESSAFTTYDLMLQDVEKYATIFKYQGYGRKKIEYTNANEEEFMCKYYVDNNLLKQHKLKNKPTTSVKLPTVTLGRLKVAKKDIQYTPVAESPFKLNYWAGARNACIRQGMRLPTSDEFELIYNNKAALKTTFKGKDYWVADEMSPCFAMAESLDGMTVSTGQNVKIHGNFTNEERKYMEKKGLLLTYSKETYYEVYPLANKKTTKGFSVRCVR